MIKKMSSCHFRTTVFGILMGLCLFLTFMTPPALADRSLTMEQIIVDAQVLPDASMQVTEKITVDFSGQWNGFYVKIPQGDTPIIDVQVSENGRPYTFNSGTEYGPPDTFLIKQEGSDILIDWSIDALDQVRTFDLTYRVVNAVKIHSDVAELYRKFIGEANGNKISYVQVNLTLPPGAEQFKKGEDIRIWGHGPLNGEVEFDGSNGVILKVSDLSAYTFMEGRVVMPTGLFTGAPVAAYTDQPALSKILAEEEGWADQANKERTMARVETGAGAGIVAVALASVLMLWRRYGRKHPTVFDGDYYRDLPANYSPAELSVLWNFKAMNAHDITATIMDLARRQFLFLEEDTVQVRKLLGSKEVTTFRLSFMPAPEPAALRKPEEAVLKPHEAELIDYLKNDIGGGKDYIYLTDIEEYAKKNGREFHAFWSGWTSDIIFQCEEYNFFDSNGKMSLLTVLGGVALFVAGFVLAARIGIIGWAMIIAGVIIFMVPRFFKRRSVTGQEDYVRWSAFKKFLEHFSDMQRHEIPSLIIWEHYLVYAVTLGVAKEVIRQLEVVFPQMQDGDYRFGSGWMMYGSYHSGMNVLNNSFDSIGNSFERSLASAKKAVSKSSSGSGGGGGFSGGGGGGGGGGSYGGR
ncbi:DUF2207 domain-containing protein [Dehalobacterium formicoaceticum]|uniref:DUF2207 domain-containing protein n=1 Tax=Dehalobacterium formicoaceticum TaxID=51515 RepID=A0ABT1Y0A0_9FIRM|nr:DUF2207 domain-containing protein [Dehalobacterium formicoaceticum]MCR6544295.1 DUF2207 domain-containing protein [Dehalobacterium formicoaceticum]